MIPSDVNPKKKQHTKYETNIFKNQMFFLEKNYPYSFSK